MIPCSTPHPAPYRTPCHVCLCPRYTRTWWLFSEYDINWISNVIRLFLLHKPETRVQLGTTRAGLVIPEATCVSPPIVQPLSPTTADSSPHNSMLGLRTSLLALEAWTEQHNFFPLPNLRKWRWFWGNKFVCQTKLWRQQFTFKEGPNRVLY